MHLLKLWALLSGVFVGWTAVGAQPTRISVGDRVVQRDVKRFGINLSGQSFYDSGQMLRNLVARNPGFQGETWQSILRCRAASRGGCTADRTAWPSGFVDGAGFEVLTGSAAGLRGTVRTSAATADGFGLTFASELRDRLMPGDFLAVRSLKPGDPTAGWWTSMECGATATAEFRDLPAGFVGHQVLRVQATAQPCGRAVLNSFFDSTAGHSFVRLRGGYTVRFQAKPEAGLTALHVRVGRENGHTFVDKAVALRPGWQSYTLAFRAEERPEEIGTAALTLTAARADILLTDVSLSGDALPGRENATVFRPEVVETLRDLRPGMLRYMDNGTDFGTSLDDWLTPAAGRPRTGYAVGTTRQEDVSVGLHEFLTLAEAVGAEPWVSLPAAFSEEEARHLMEYLAGDVHSRYGGVRAGLGHPQAWVKIFPRIHLELGNEQWNRGSFAGATIDDPAAFGQRTAAVFQAMRASPVFESARFDLVAGSFFEDPGYTEREAAALHKAADSIAVAPYLFATLNAAPGMEGVYGPMLAQPEVWTTLGGTLRRQDDAVRAASPGTRLSLYEVNLGTVAGDAAITQAAIDRTVPTMGAALDVADLMLLALRDLRVTEQCFFALPEFRNGFTSPGGGGAARTTPLFGAVIDMGGATDRRRPTFLALRTLNEALLPNLLETTVTGADPTWMQPPGPNGNVAMTAVHLLQSFAFADGDRRSLIVLNLSRTEALPVTFGGARAPSGTVRQTVLTAAHIEDGNEEEHLVVPQTRSIGRFDPAAEHVLPPFSVTTYVWKTL